jgi:flagellar protein FliS
MESSIRTYQQISTRSDIESASPHRLVQLMMERVLTKISLAANYMESESVSEKGIHIGDAISLIDGLQASLNHKPNARLAGNFDALYDYMKRRLLEANLRNDRSILEEVAGLMKELKSAWDAIG